MISPKLNLFLKHSHALQYFNNSHCVHYRVSTGNLRTKSTLLYSETLRTLAVAMAIQAFSGSRILALGTELNKNKEVTNKDHSPGSQFLVLVKTQQFSKKSGSFNIRHIFCLARQLLFRITMQARGQTLLSAE